MAISIIYGAYAKLSQLGVPTKTVLEHGEVATTTLGAELGHK
ncbi:hypothetical protein [Undibacterium flavidum]|nr:hypothetical protein [Undibacterium flavidum]